MAEQGFDLIVGFDEVGRGALAGPVMVGAAAIWAKDLDDLEVPEGVADSKLLSPKRREAMFGPLRDWCAASAVGQATNVEIDEWGISCALGVAALRALKSVEDDLALAGGQGEDGGKSAASLSSASSNGLRVGAILDGPFDYITQSADMFGAPAVPLLAAVHTKVKADQSCALVSVASVAAKVTRDRLMVSIAHGNPRYEPYQWERNKGYGSAAHRAAIAEHGPTDLHRLSWHLV
ncbi:ribonuclease HII [Bifidobacterium sp. ESL0763]|uniref:ribonuclease HII n=1 Tax=Bifidobacterium sp. ESL0763 TaxID=2983227 RepID=UPI0023F718C6|nr:ribonuclease HII [Bifidobacterium sp. ESL0763]MDF7663384.1 ribonuclease HII [Bifidobacterium sp. ESL0763]